MIIIFDLDGTIADCEHRRPLVVAKQWREFYAACGADKPVKGIVQLMHATRAVGHTNVVLSGRSDEVRNTTEDWMEDNEIPLHFLVMRKEGDYTPDDILKLAMLNTFLADRNLTSADVLFIVDDRKKVVDMWRREGYLCLQCAEGNF